MLRIDALMRMAVFQRLAIFFAFTSWSPCHGLLVTRQPSDRATADPSDGINRLTIPFEEDVEDAVTEEESDHRANLMRPEAASTETSMTYSSYAAEMGEKLSDPNLDEKFLRVTADVWGTQDMTGLPTFYLDDDTRTSLGWSKTLIKVLENHPLRVNTKDEAKLIFIGHNEDWRSIVELPDLSAGRAYVSWTKESGIDQVDPRGVGIRLKNRTDSGMKLLFLSYDLNETSPTNRLPYIWHGVTVPPHCFYHGNASDLKSYDWTISFQGANHQGKRGPRTRQALRDSAEAAATNHTMPDKVYVNVAGPAPYINYFANATLQSTHPENVGYYDLLTRSAFHLVPRGDRTWSYRFMDVIGACSIPVILADRMTLPFEDIIDWSEASIRLSESEVNGRSRDPMALKQLIDELPKDPEKIRQMREKVCEINEKYFASPAKRVQGMLLALSKHL